MGVGIGLGGEDELAEVAQADRPGGLLAGAGEGGHEDGDQQGQNGDHDQQLDDGEGRTAIGSV